MLVLAAQGVCYAQTQPVCVPGTPFCVQTDGRGGVQVSGAAQGQAGPGGASAGSTGSATGSGNAQGSANGNAGATGHGGVQASSNGGVQAAGSGNAGATTSGSASGAGHAGAAGQAQGHAGADANGGAAATGNAGAGGFGATEGTSSGGYSYGRTRSSRPIRYGTGLAFCGTVKAGVFSGVKGGGCFAVSFRTEYVTFEMETQLLYGGVRESIDWVFPMSFMIPLTSEQSLYEGLFLKVGGSPIGVTFASAENGGSYLRFGLHAGASYEWDVNDYFSWRVFDARAFLDFGTRREVDLRGNFLDFGAQLSSGIVF